MKVKEVTLARTFNLGNFENIKPEITADIEENENVQDVLKKLNKELCKFKDEFEAY